MIANQKLRLNSVSPFRAALSGGILTVFYLLGGLLSGVLLGNLVFGVLPGHMNSPIRIALAAVPALAGLMMGSALWGASLGRLAGASDTRRMAWAGGLGFAPVTLALAIALQLLEPFVLERLGEGIPMHRLFTLLFVPAAFLIAATGSAALGIGLRNDQLARRLALRAGLASAIAFLVINLLMEALGWIVGAPRAAERFTMLTVLFVSDLAAAFAGGAVIGFSLWQEK